MKNLKLNGTAGGACAYWTSFAYYTLEQSVCVSTEIGMHFGDNMRHWKHNSFHLITGVCIRFSSDSKWIRFLRLATSHALFRLFVCTVGIWQLIFYSRYGRIDCSRWIEINKSIKLRAHNAQPLAAKLFPFWMCTVLAAGVVPYIQYRIVIFDENTFAQIMKCVYIYYILSALAGAWRSHWLKLHNLFDRIVINGVSAWQCAGGGQWRYANSLMACDMQIRPNMGINK